MDEGKESLRKSTDDPQTSALNKGVPPCKEEQRPSLRLERQTVRYTQASLEKWVDKQNQEHSIEIRDEFALQHSGFALSCRGKLVLGLRHLRQKTRMRGPKMHGGNVSA
jgi:hypothetical protein